MRVLGAWFSAEKHLGAILCFWASWGGQGDRNWNLSPEKGVEPGKESTLSDETERALCLGVTDKTKKKKLFSHCAPWFTLFKQ